MERQLLQWNLSIEDTDYSVLVKGDVPISKIHVASYAYCVAGIMCSVQ